MPDDREIRRIAWLTIGEYDREMGVVNVKDEAFGAVGDGVTDDKTAIQAAIDSVYTDGGGIVYLPIGSYLLASGIDLKHGVRLIGDGMTATTIKGTFAGVLITYKALVDGQELLDVWLEHMTIDGVAAVNGGTGIALIPTQVAGAGADSCRQCGLLNVRTRNLSKGLHLYTTQQFSVERCKFISCTNGVYYTAEESVTGTPQLVRFEHCDFRSNGKGLTGVYVSGSKPYFWHFENCHFEVNTTHGIDLNGGGAVAWSFDTCKWEQNGTAIDLTGAEMFLFETCYFNGNPITGGTEQVRAVQAGPSDGGGHRFVKCAWGGSATAKDIRFDFVPRVSLIDCQLSANGITNTQSEIKQINTYVGVVQGPAIVTRHSISVWIAHTQTGTNYVGIYPTNSSSYAGNSVVWIEEVKIHVTDAFVRAGGTQTVIQVGDEAGAQGISQSQDVETTGIKTPVLNSEGYTARAAAYFAVTLFTDGTLSAGKALVIINYSEVPLKP